MIVELLQTKSADEIASDLGINFTSVYRIARGAQEPKDGLGQKIRELHRSVAGQ